MASPRTQLIADRRATEDRGADELAQRMAQDPALQAALENDPTIRAIRQRAASGDLPTSLKSMGNSRSREIVQSFGYELPDGYFAPVAGGVERSEPFPWLRVALGGAAALLGPLAIAAMTGGGAAGAAATGGGAAAPAVAPAAAAGGTAAAGSGAAAAGGGAAALGGGGAAAAGGGFLSRLPGWLDAGSRALGAAADARAEQRSGEQMADTIAGQREAQNITSDLAQRRFLNENRTQATNEALRGSFLRGVQDVNITAPEGITVPQITGGLRPSAIPDRDTIGRALYTNALRELEDPTRVASDPDAREGRTLPALPKIDTASSGSGMLDNVLSWGSLAGSVLPFLNNRSRAAAPTPAAPTLVNNQVPNAPAVNPLVNSAANRSLLGRGVRF